MSDKKCKNNKKPAEFKDNKAFMCHKCGHQSNKATRLCKALKNPS